MFLPRKHEGIAHNRAPVSFLQGLYVVSRTKQIKEQKIQLTQILFDIFYACVQVFALTMHYNCK